MSFKIRAPFIPYFKKEQAMTETPHEKKVRELIIALEKPEANLKEILLETLKLFQGYIKGNG